MEGNPVGRGRARGRARQAREQARRPGEEPERGGALAAPADVYPGQGNGGGRRTHRGVPRVDPVPAGERPPPPTQMEGVSEAMARASIADTSETGRGRSSYGAGNDNTKPAHVTDKKGSSGDPISLLANYFEVISQPTWRIYQYHCDFEPVVESSKMRRGLVRDHQNTLGPHLFDGMSDLKSVKQLGESLELFSKRNTDGENIRIIMKRVNELAPSHPEVQRLFNTLMRRNLFHMDFKRIGRHMFDPAAMSEIPQYNLQVWQGVVTSIRQHEKNIMMCVDTTHRIVRKETALNLIKSIAANPRGDVREACTKELVGNIVMTRYNNRTYRIEDIDWTLNPTMTFEGRSGPTKYMDYYMKEYGIQIQDLGQPLLLATSKEKEIKRGASVSKKIYLVPEICCMTGLTEAMRTNFTTMKDVGLVTRVNPDKRVQHLNKFIERLNRNENVITEMNNWDLKFSNNLVEIQARIVPCESIFMRTQNKTVPRDKDFTMLIRSDPMHVSVDLHNWLVLFTRADSRRCAEMLSVLSSVAHKLGMNISKPQMCELRDDRINSYFAALKENFIPGTTQLVMLVLPNNKKERYDALKKYTCIDNAVPSQCVLSKTIGKPKGLMTVATKVAIQLNCKLGGVPWALFIPFKVKVMVCGYDTYHDSSRKGRSAGAFVASLNQEFTHWYSKVSFHQAGGWQELSDHMRYNFTVALRKFHQVNNALPDLIIVYRDGVGDGQIRYVREWEIQQLKTVLKENFKDKEVRFSFIVVNKRINTRFFQIQQRTISNPPHGTVVDNVVTRYDRYDFFLVSQVATQGTVSPTMYNVIEDSSNLKPEYIQRLSYKLTHLYFNLSGTISVPAPCQYAHKLAFLTGQSLHQEPKEELCDKLFYL